MDSVAVSFNREGDGLNGRDRDGFKKPMIAIIQIKVLGGISTVKNKPLAKMTCMNDHDVNWDLIRMRK